MGEQPCLSPCACAWFCKVRVDGFRYYARKPDCIFLIYSPTQPTHQPMDSFLFRASFISPLDLTNSIRRTARSGLQWATQIGCKHEIHARWERGIVSLTARAHGQQAKAHDHRREPAKHGFVPNKRNNPGIWASHRTAVHEREDKGEGDVPKGCEAMPWVQVHSQAGWDRR